ncbi:MAG: hypothetical protein GY757_05515 [bacterium]|nr:hypothetical protein [bacterium]
MFRMRRLPCPRQAMSPLSVGSIVLLLFMLVFPGQQSLFSQNPNYKFDRISAKDGLSQVTVNCILQDSKGFLWFATQNGLNKYDGCDFTLYIHSPDDPQSLGNNFVQCLYEDHKGFLWVGTFYGGLNAINLKTGRFCNYKNIPGDPSSLSDNNIWTIMEDKAGFMWIGTLGGGLNRFDRKTQTFSHFKNEPGNPSSLSGNRVLSIAEDCSGALWVGTFKKGLNILNKKTGKFARFSHITGDPSGLSNNTVESICEDKSGNMWLGTRGGGINVFDKNRILLSHFKNTSQRDSLSSDFILDIFKDASGNLWIGTDGGGLNVYKNNGKFFTLRHNGYDPQSLSSDVISCIYESRCGVLWFSAYSKGLCKLNRRQEQFKHFKYDALNPNSLREDTIYALLETRSGDLWVGTPRGGISRLNRKTGQFSHFLYTPGATGADGKKKRHRSVQALYEDSTGMLWVGTFNEGLIRFDSKNNRFHTYLHDPRLPGSIGSNTILSILEDKKGSLWIGLNGQGLSRFDRKHDSFRSFRLPGSDSRSMAANFINLIYEDSFENLWVATNGGLYTLDRNSGLFKQYKGLSHIEAAVVHESKAGVLWVGTFSGGLNKFLREKGVFQHAAVFTSANGLPCDTIYGILEDSSGFLWLTTEKGLAKFDPKTNLSRNYDVTDGLQSDEFMQGAFYKSPLTGEMFIGGINGFNIFNPDTFKENPHIPPVRITAVKKYNVKIDTPKPLYEMEELLLSYGDDMISFNFAALDYTVPDKNCYAYKMEGFDEQWLKVCSKHRFATYTNLGAGEYVFRVRGSNNHGVWNKNGASLSIKIPPPYWQTWWAYCFYFILALSLLTAGNRLKMRKMRNKQKELMELVKKRTLELEKANTLKSELAQIAAHDLKNPLQLIIAHAFSLEAELPGEPKLRKRLSKIHRSSEQMLDIIEKLLETAAIENGKLKLHKSEVDVGKMALASVKSNKTAARRKKQKLFLNFDRNCLVMADRVLLRQVMDNLLANSIKFSPRGLPIRVAVKKKNGRVVFRVTDKGPGLTADDMEKLFGRFQRLSAKPTGNESSTGLGLSICKNLVELHSGTIRAESKPGEECSFIVELPILKELSHENSETNTLKESI